MRSLFKLALLIKDIYWYILKKKGKEMSEIDWIVNEEGQAFRPKEEPTSFVDPNQFINSQSCFESPEDFLINRKINDLIKSGKISVTDAGSARQQIKNMDYLEKENFLSAIEQGAKNKDTHGKNKPHYKGSWDGAWNP
jgi:hypothetical protein